MKVIKVSDIYNVTQISKTNNDAWEKLIEVMKNETGDVQLDFLDIRLEEPWNNEAFKKLLGNERVHIKIYSSEKVKDTIEMACRLGNLKTGRVENEDEIIEDIVPNRNAEVEILTKRFRDSIDIVKGVGMLDLADLIGQISGFNTVKAIENAIEYFSDMTGTKEFAINTEYMFIQINIIELLAKMIGKFRSKGITVTILSKEKEVEGKIRIYQCISSTSKLTPADKVKMFNDIIDKGTVGMLSKFKDTKRLDEFGRKGEGKPIICRVAIFDHIDKNMEAHFTTFNGKYFYTKMHYALENDGEELKALRVEKIKVPIQQLGLCNRYFGSLYHFNFPVQQSLEDYITTYGEDADGMLVEKKITLPQHIQSVLKDFGVKYNEPSLINAIIETDNYLKELENSIEDDE